MSTWSATDNEPHCRVVPLTKLDDGLLQLNLLMITQSRSWQMSRWKN